MVGSSSSSAVSDAARRRWGVVAYLALVVGSLAVGGSVARADQTVRFDGAGDAPRISLVGDSTLAGVRWYGRYGDLERYNFVLSAESCRRTVTESCVSREGYRSATVVEALRTLDGELGELLFVMSGYNDPVTAIDEAITAVVDEARRQGVGHVVWLSLRTSGDVDYSDPQEQADVNTFREYNERLVAAAVESGGFLQVADWTTHSEGAAGWFGSDGVHLTPDGADAVAGFIADVAARVLDGEDVSPAAVPWTLLAPGAEGTIVVAVQEALVADGVALVGGIDGVYGDDTMVAVAEYQRRDGALQETGAVDEATARALGVLGGADGGSTTTPPTTVASTSVAGPAPVVPAAPVPGGAADRTGHGRWPVVTGAVLAVLVAAFVGRRRYVVARRAARRWARVHPATSPRRSVADVRRAAALDAGARGPLYDQEREVPASGG